MEVGTWGGMPYQLLKEFRSLFERKVYHHRSSTNGDKVAIQMYEDLLSLGRSKKYVSRVSTGSHVVNTRNLVTGRKTRRGDGSFGELLPHLQPQAFEGHAVRRGPIANLEIGVETKILATAIGKQVQERISSLKDQAVVFRSKNPNVICVAIVGINYAKSYLAYEGTRTQMTDGKGYPHPVQQAAAAEAKVRAELASDFEEVIILPFVATNQDPFLFSWTNTQVVTNEYGAALIRISQEYEQRFP